MGDLRCCHPGWVHHRCMHCCWRRHHAQLITPVETVFLLSERLTRYGKSVLELSEKCSAFSLLLQGPDYNSCLRNAVHSLKLLIMKLKTITILIFSTIYLVEK